MRDLPLAVVSERRRLQHGRAADTPKAVGADRSALAPDKRRHRRCRGSADERLLANAMLRDLQRAAVRPDDRVRLGGGGGRRRHVLEFERHDVDGARERADRDRGRRTTR